VLDRRFANSSQASRAIGVDRYNIIRWRRGQRVQAQRADEIACALGLHPCDIWPDWYVVTDEHERAVAKSQRAAKARKNNARTRRRAQAREASCPTTTS
jgi:type II secretory pathway component PulL